MAPNNQQQQATVAPAAIRLPEFYADSPQSWFNCLDSTFATANITQYITKFHWALAKLSFSLIATIRPLWRNPTAVSDPYKETPFRNSLRSPSPFRCKMPGGDKGRRRSPTPGAAKGGPSDGLCFYHSRFSNKAHKCEKGCSYQEN